MNSGVCGRVGSSYYTSGTCHVSLLWTQVIWPQNSVVLWYGSILVVGLQTMVFIRPGLEITGRKDAKCICFYHIASENWHVNDKKCVCIFQQVYKKPFYLFPVPKCVFSVFNFRIHFIRPSKFWPDPSEMLTQRYLELIESQDCGANSFQKGEGQRGKLWSS